MMVDILQARSAAALQCGKESNIDELEYVEATEIIDSEVSEVIEISSADELPDQLEPIVVEDDASTCSD
eukprot:5819774-Karenia_brevis.AAC.1